MYFLSCLLLLPIIMASERRVEGEWCKDSNDFYIKRPLSGKLCPNGDVPRRGLLRGASPEVIARMEYYGKTHSLVDARITTEASWVNVARDSTSASKVNCCGHMCLSECLL